MPSKKLDHNNVAWFSPEDLGREDGAHHAHGEYRILEGTKEIDTPAGVPNVEQSVWGGLAVGVVKDGAIKFEPYEGPRKNYHPRREA